jgi:hypothetical protein
MQGDYKDIVWTLASRDSSRSSFFWHKQVQVQVSINTYYNMLDARKDYDTNLTTPF